MIRYKVLQNCMLIGIYLKMTEFLNDIANNFETFVMTATKTMAGTFATVATTCLVGSFGAIMMIFGEVKPILIGMQETLQETKIETRELKEEYRKTGNKIQVIYTEIETQKQRNSLIEKQINHLLNRVDSIDK